MSGADHRETSTPHGLDAVDVSDLLRSVERPGTGFRVATTLLILVILGGWVVFGRQLLYGLGVTGLNQPVA